MPKISRFRVLVVLAVLAALAVLLVAGTGRLKRGMAAGPPPPENAELVQNGGFEEAGEPLPGGWSRDEAATRGKGRAAADKERFHTGRTSLRLEPTSQNGGSAPLAVTQIIPAATFRGRTVRLSGFLRAEGGAAAVLSMLSLVKGKPKQLEGVAETGEWAYHEKEYTIPDDPSVQLVLICSANGQKGSAWFDDISVMYGTAPPAPRAAAKRELAPMRAAVRIDTARVVRQIPRTLFGANVEWTWNGNLLWNPEKRAADPGLLQLTKDLGLSMLRYPGGYYSDYYHWKDGIGPLDKRPTVRHDGSGRDKTRPNFGTDEALEFAAQAGAELLITVNAGTGTAAEAADWVRYVNGRGQRVRYWEIGNELYINDGSPISKEITVDPATYAKRVREFAQAMRAADPKIRIGAIGGENQPPYGFVNYPDWNKIVLERAGDQIDYFAIHNAYAPVNVPDQSDLRQVYTAMLAAPTLIGRNLATVSRQIQEFAPRRPGGISIAVTEWGPLFQVEPKGRYAQHNKTLGSALFVASTLKTLIESPATDIANFHLLNDLGFMGWIGPARGGSFAAPRWTPTPRYYSFQIFARHFGPQLLRSDTDSPTYDTRGVGAVGAVRQVPSLDVVSSLSADSKQLFIVGINKDLDRPMETTIDLGGFVPAANATAWTLNGTGIDANTGTAPLPIPGLTWGRPVEDPENPRFSSGGPEEVTFTAKPVKVASNRFSYTFPAHSVTSLVLTRR